LQIKCHDVSPLAPLQKAGLQRLLLHAACKIPIAKSFSLAFCKCAAMANCDETSPQACGYPHPPRDNLQGSTWEIKIVRRKGTVT
jgi:hypothetical protein